MSVVQLYSLPQVIHLSTGPGAPNMNYPINRTDLKVFRHLRTKINILLKNIDRKVVTLAGGSSLLIQAYDVARDEVVFLKTLTLTDPSQGLWEFTVNPGDIADWTPRMINYIVMVQDANAVRTPIYTDRNYTHSGILEILPGPLVPASDPILVDPEEFTLRGDYYYSSALMGAAQVANPSGQHTAAIYGDHFNGKVTVEVSLDDDPTADDSQWSEVEVFDTADLEEEELDGVEQITFEGNFMWVRFVIFVRTNGGAVEKILFRN